MPAFLPKPWVKKLISRLEIAPISCHKTTQHTSKKGFSRNAQSGNILVSIHYLKVNHSRRRNDDMIQSRLRRVGWVETAGRL